MRGKGLNLSATVKILSIGTDRPEQTVPDHQIAPEGAVCSGPTLLAV